MNLNYEQIKSIALTTRILAAETVEKAKSGHPGLPMGAADFATLLWAKHLRFNPENPNWAGRDRFILSAGHGCALLYTLLHLFGYNLPMKELQSFRQWDSKTPGHPEFGWTDGVESTTGPLGQGTANAVGIALSAKMLQARYNEMLFDYKVYALVSDGDLMEGLSAEAASLAGHWGLNNLIYLYDDNKITLAGKASIIMSEDVAKRYEAYGWFVQSCDGHNLELIDACIEKAKAEKSRPSIILCKTTIGFGSPHKAGDFEVHGAPLGAEELAATKKNLGWESTESFYISPEVKKLCTDVISANKNIATAWDADFNEWESKDDKGATYKSQASRNIPAALKTDLLKEFAEAKKEATRSTSSRAIQVIAKHLTGFVGGSADLDPSTKTFIKGSDSIQKTDFIGKNIHFGVREHAMGAIANGLSYSKVWFPYTATFLVFADYMRPTIRLAAISHLQTLFIFTHDSYAVGEDGPTHEPVEQVQSLRIIPNNFVFRPADGIETAMSYVAALDRKKGPSCLIFSRQDLAPIQREASFSPDDILKGGYVVSGKEITPEVVFVATGSEVSLACEAAKTLTGQGKKVRVVSMPCVELFLAQDEAYRNSVLPAAAKKVSIEAGVTSGWHKIVGGNGVTIGLDHYGASAPAGILAEKFGFTVDAILKKI